MGQLDASIIGQVRPFQMPSWAASQERGYALRDLGRKAHAVQDAAADTALVRRALDWGTDHQTGQVDYGKAAQWAATLGQRPDIADRLQQEAASRAADAAKASRGEWLHLSPGGSAVNTTTGARYEAPFKPEAAPKPEKPHLVQDTGTGTWFEPQAGVRSSLPPHAGRAPHREALQQDPETGVWFRPREGAQTGRKQAGTTSVGPDGTVTTTPAGKMSEAQGNASAFGTRADASNRILDQLEQPGGAPVTNFRARSLQRLPLIGNMLTSESLQEYDAAKLNFITAVLRKESGAAIPESEFANEERKYFPQPGDRPGTIHQKQAARRLAIESLQTQAGRALPDVRDNPAAYPGGVRPRTAAEPRTLQGGHQVPQSWARDAAPPTMTRADVQATARASGKTEAQVIAAAKAKGYTIR